MKKKNCRPQALSKLYYVTGSQLNTLVSYTCTTFTCVYACKYENWVFWGFFFCLLAFVISWIPEHCSGLTIRFKKILTSSHLETSGSLLFKMNLKIFIPIRLFSNYCFLQLHNIKAQINIRLINVLGVYIHCMVCYTQWLTIAKYDCLVFFKQLEN